MKIQQPIWTSDISRDEFLVMMASVKRDVYVARNPSTLEVSTLSYKQAGVINAVAGRTGSIINLSDTYQTQSQEAVISSFIHVSHLSHFSNLYQGRQR